MRSDLLLIVGSRKRYACEYIFARVSRDDQIWLITATEPTWERRYVAGWTVLDIMDVEKLALAAEEVAERHDVAGVMCFCEFFTVSAAHVAARLGVNGTSPDAVQLCRDKASTRATLHSAGVPQPAAVAVSTLTQARSVADSFGYPVVCKPRAAASSIGVCMAADADRLAAAFESASSGDCPDAPSFAAGVLVEQYLVGDEISVDSVVVDGLVQPLVIAHKQMAFAPHFVEVGHVIDGADPLLADPILHRELAAVHRALGISNGVTHSEWRLTSDGPRLVEVNPRLGGDLIPLVGGECVGIDVIQAAVAVATGTMPETARAPHGVAAIAVLYSQHCLVVRELRVSEASQEEASQVIFTAAIGDSLSFSARDSRGRYGLIIARAATVGGCNELIERARSRVYVNGESAERLMTAGA
jgi:biotin carboxylase